MYVCVYIFMCCAHVVKMFTLCVCLCMCVSVCVCVGVGVLVWVCVDVYSSGQ